MTNYLNAKNGIEILHDDGLTQILTGIEDPSIFGKKADVGSIYLRTISGGGIYNKTTSLDTGWTLIASGIGTSVVCSGITPVQHIALHNGNKYIEYNRVANKVVSEDEWLDSTKTYHISSTALHRMAGKVVSFEKRIYDYETGTNVIATLSGIINRVGNRVVSIQYERDNLIGGY